MLYTGILAINRIMRPEDSITGFMRFAAESGFSAIELRNDLSDVRILGSNTASEIQEAASETGVSILTINALQRFNDPALFSEKLAELADFIREAHKIACPMIVFCPVNDPNDARSIEQQNSDLIAALQMYAPILRENNITGLLEPLGFPICSMRYKKQAAVAIKASGCSSQYKIVHDTFHHYLSGETVLFPKETGLMHISGVLPGKSRAEITDEDRILITQEDCMGNKIQVDEMLKRGYTGPISYEPFSPKIQSMALDQLKKELQESLQVVLS